MTIALPPSLQKERHTLADEVAWARSLSPEERLAVVAAVCRDTISVLELNEKRDFVLSYRDPVPESTRRAFERLRLELRSRCAARSSV